MWFLRPFNWSIILLIWKNLFSAWANMSSSVKFSSFVIMDWSQRDTLSVIFSGCSVFAFMAASTMIMISCGCNIQTKDVYFITYRFCMYCLIWRWSLGVRLYLICLKLRFYFHRAVKMIFWGIGLMVSGDLPDKSDIAVEGSISCVKEICCNNKFFLCT